MQQELKFSHTVEAEGLVPSDSSSNTDAEATWTSAAGPSHVHDANARVLVVLMPWEWRGPEDYAVRSCTFNAALRPSVDIVALPDTAGARAAWAALRGALSMIMDWQAVWYVPALPDADHIEFDAFENWTRAILALADNGWVHLAHKTVGLAPTRGLAPRHTVAPCGISPKTPSTAFHQQIEEVSMHANELKLLFPFRDCVGADTDGPQIPPDATMAFANSGALHAPTAPADDAKPVVRVPIAQLATTYQQIESPGDELVVHELSSVDSAGGSSPRSTTPPASATEALPIIMPRYVDHACFHALTSLGADCRVFGDAWHTVNQKEWIHPVVPSRAALILEIPKNAQTGLSLNQESARDCGLVAGVHMPRGFRCYSKSELLEGFHLLQAQGVAKVVLKPGQGASGGRGIIFGVTSADLHAIPDAPAEGVPVQRIPAPVKRYPRASDTVCRGSYTKISAATEAMITQGSGAASDAAADSSLQQHASTGLGSGGEALGKHTNSAATHRVARAKVAVWSLEEMVDLAMHEGEPPSVVSPAVHLIGSELSLPRTEQLIFGKAEFFGSVAPPRAPKSLMTACEDIMFVLQRKLRMRGFWGADFLVDRRTGLPLLTDLNVGRPNGAHPAKMALAIHAPGAKGMVFFKFHCPASTSWEEVEELWQDAGVLFRDSPQHSLMALGVIPVAIAVGGVSLGLALADTLEQAEKARDVAMAVIGGDAC